MFGEILLIIDFRDRQLQVIFNKVAGITPDNNKLGLFAGLLNNTFCLFSGNYSFLGGNVQGLSNAYLIFQLCNALIQKKKVIILIFGGLSARTIRISYVR